MEKYYLWFSRYWLYFLLVSYILFIIYTTAVPFNFVFSGKMFVRRFSRIDWIPFYGKHHLIARADVVANIIFFVPLGILLGLQKILSLYRRYTYGEWFTILGIGFSISAMVEFLQLFTIDRHTSVTDVLMNTGGTFLGAGLILVIYLKFHLSIKTLLQQLFFEKSEISIAAVLLIFIGLSYSLPFTFQLNIYSILRNFRELSSSRIEIPSLLLSLLSSILMYGTLSYLLLCGIYRYFLAELRRHHLLLILLFFFTLPILLEIYQLLIPIRNHSLSDIFSAQVGLLIGAIFFYLQRPWMAVAADGNHQGKGKYFTYYLHYFETMLVVYLIYLMIFFTSGFGKFYPAGPALIWPVPESLSELQSIKLWRLQLLLHFNKEVFTFLPAGFILSLIASEWENKYWRLVVTMLLMLMICCYSYQLYLTSIYFILNLCALLGGLYLGWIFWKIFKFLVCRYPIEHENHF